MPKSTRMDVPYKELTVASAIMLRQLQPEDASTIFTLVDNDREYLGAWLPWVAHTKSPADSEQFIKETLRKRIEGSEYGYVIIVDGKPVGHISLMHIADKKDPEVGYWIASEASGKGITTKAAGTLTDFGFNTLGLQRIVIQAEPGNIASNKVAEKLGYTLESTSHDESTSHTLNVWSKTTSSAE